MNNSYHLPTSHPTPSKAGSRFPQITSNPPQARIWIHLYKKFRMLQVLMLAHMSVSVCVLLYYGLPMYQRYRYCTANMAGACVDSNVIRLEQLNTTPENNLELNTTPGNNLNLNATPENKPKLILAWTRFHGGDLPKWGTGREAFKKLGCEVTNCEMTKNREEVERADAVLFHMRDFKNKDKPKVRHRHQRYVFYLLESPIHTYNDLKALAGFFNWTCTYREDSDISAAYGFLGNLTYDPNHDYMGNRSNKQPYIAWLVSNCHTQSKRNELVKVLHKKHGLEVAIYGKCRNPRKECRNRKDPLSCADFVEQRYLFYLALENSLCQDYITEKFFNYITRDIIPVGLSGANYTSLVPDSALITIRPGTNLTHIAQRIKTLASDRRAYNAHFRWRDGFSGYHGTSETWCRLCKKLNDPQEKEKVYEDIHGWWVEKKCQPKPTWA